MWPKQTSPRSFHRRMLERMQTSMRVSTEVRDALADYQREAREWAELDVQVRE